MLDYIPDVLRGMAELAACDTRAKTVVADRDFVVHVLVGKVILSLSHGSDKYTHALLGSNIGNVISHAYDW